MPKNTGKWVKTEIAGNWVDLALAGMQNVMNVIFKVVPKEQS